MGVRILPSFLDNKSSSWPILTTNDLSSSFSRVNQASQVEVAGHVGRLIGETASRRSGIEAELEKSLKQIDEARKFARKQRLDAADPEIDAFLKQSCNAIESFNREVTMTCYEADNTCLLFKKQIESILSAGHSRSAANVYSGDEADTRSRLKRKCDSLSFFV